eukprot:TRINITY_DN15725_c0_g1_i1.p1 TRINITY_DN15725_c0_g1~~TRINITY_DN15725_c0_g1_i1.p1  ORF type:complete len:450 (+),score=74.53 TRINITY_DN15725_c0_g1_i1:60-1352(+)
MRETKARNTALRNQRWTFLIWQAACVMILVFRTTMRRGEEEEDYVHKYVKIPVMLNGSVLMDSRRVMEVNKGKNGIPMLIHQSYKSKMELKDTQRRWMGTWNAQGLAKGWKHVFWSDEENERLIKESLPWFYQTYKSYPHHIQRADIARIAVLRMYGGIYVDTDYECLRTECLAVFTRQNCSVNLIEGPSSSVDGLFQNTMMSSTPNPYSSLFWDNTLRLAERLAQTKSIKAVLGWYGSGQVMGSTGPGLLTHSYAEHVGVDISSVLGTLHNFKGGKLIQLFYSSGKMVKRDDSTICQLPEATYSGQRSGNTIGLAAMHHNTKTWVSAVHATSYYFPRVVVCYLLSLPCFFVPYSVVWLLILLVVLFTQGFPSSPLEVIVYYLSVAITVQVIRYFRPYPRSNIPPYISIRRIPTMGSGSNLGSPASSVHW